jgi:hypothetical protein
MSSDKFPFIEAFKLIQLVGGNNNYGAPLIGKEKARTIFGVFVKASKMTPEKLAEELAEQYFYEQKVAGWPPDVSFVEEQWRVAAKWEQKAKGYSAED